MDQDSKPVKRGRTVTNNFRWTRTVIEGVFAFGQRRTRHGFHGDDTRVLPVREVLVEKRKRHSTDVASGAVAGDNDVRVLTGELELLESLEPDDRLVAQ